MSPVDLHPTPISSTGWYVHEQQVPASQWGPIAHGLGYEPNVAVIDSGGNEVIADVLHHDDFSLTISFAVAFGGTATMS